MTISNINSIEDITEDQVATLSGLAENLSMQSDDVIQLYVNSVIMNPETQRALESQDTLQASASDSNQDIASDAIDFYSEDDESFGLITFPEDDSFFEGLWYRVKALFIGLKKKVRRIFCQVVTAIGGNEELDLKTIIRDVLIALIPALAASTGLMSVALPIVVSLGAMLIKYGVAKVCPV